MMEGDQEESVYNLLPRPQVVMQRPPRHESKVSARATCCAARRALVPAAPAPAAAAPQPHMYAPRRPASPQFAATANAPTFSGAAPRRPAATMGRAGGMAAERPDSFLRAHAKEPLLPERECTQ